MYARIRHPLAHASVLVAMLALVAGCGSTTKLDEPARAPVETRTPVAAATAGAGTSAAATAAPQSRVATVDLARDGAAAGAGSAAALAAGPRVVYFDFDSYAIKDEFQPLIVNQAKLLSANRGRHVVVEGHTDERGGSEYNLALGQKRAAAVVQALTLLGAGEAQLEAVSFGKERPAVAGSDEAAWARNRRAELKDR